MEQKMHPKKSTPKLLSQKAKKKAKKEMAHTTVTGAIPNSIGFSYTKNP